MPIVDPETTDTDAKDDGDATNQGVSATDPAEGSDNVPAEDDGSPAG
ncbi:hypothetical protein ACFOKI_14420 [Sphingomonas qilianensis]|uniref:Uncharacterized protein n=1 Tax=Sphingomonas qilianensis TaxID=1736690 RepID=A0ABU9XND0_9SPHN